MKTSMFKAVQIRLERLIEIATAITAEQDLDKLLELILTSAVELTFADAGSIYIREDDNLFFRIALNQTLSERDKKALTQSFGKSVSIPISQKSLAGYVAMKNNPLNIADAYKINNQPYFHNRAFDEANNYECHSMLLHPMKNHRNSIVGVIQLINANYNCEEQKFTEFSADDEKIISTLSSLAGIAIDKSLLIQELNSSYRTIMARMARAVELKEADPDTYVHIIRISKYAEIVATQLGLHEDYVRVIRDAAPMHDIGKQCIPDAVLFKPGKLTDEEFDKVKMHTVFGAEIFEGLDEPIAKVAHNITRYHHEKYNGFGYPTGLKGEEIPIEARVVAVVDVFDALCSNRVYKKAMPVEKALEILKKDSGSHFDPKVVNAFIECLDKILLVRDRYEDIKDTAAQKSLEELLNLPL